jgi:hypothetical protein
MRMLQEGLKSPSLYSSCLLCLVGSDRGLWWRRAGLSFAKCWLSPHLHGSGFERFRPWAFRSRWPDRLRPLGGWSLFGSYRPLEASPTLPSRSQFGRCARLCCRSAFCSFGRDATFDGSGFFSRGTGTWRPLFPLCHMLPRKTHSLAPAVMDFSRIIPVVHDVLPHSTKQKSASMTGFPMLVLCDTIFIDQWNLRWTSI